MSFITVLSETIQITQFGGSNAVLRIYSDRDFRTPEGEMIPRGVPGSRNFFREIACTILGTFLTIPNFDLPTTTDGIGEQRARYTAVLYDKRNRFKRIHLKSFPVRHDLGLSQMTWGALDAGRRAAFPIDNVNVQFVNALANSLTQQITQVQNNLTETEDTLRDELQPRTEILPTDLPPAEILSGASFVFDISSLPQSFKLHALLTDQNLQVEISNEPTFTNVGYEKLLEGADFYLAAPVILDRNPMDEMVYVRVTNLEATPITLNLVLNTSLWIF
jgi:hypothetical protein